MQYLFSLSDLLHSVWQSLGPSTSLQMTQFIPFYDWVIFHCIYVCTTSSSFIPLFMDIRLCPCPGHCKYCCSEHWGACIFWNYGFLWVCVQGLDCWVIFLVFYGTSILFSCLLFKRGFIFTFLLSSEKVSLHLSKSILTPDLNWITLEVLLYELSLLLWLLLGSLSILGSHPVTTGWVFNRMSLDVGQFGVSTD